MIRVETKIKKCRMSTSSKAETQCYFSILIKLAEVQEKVIKSLLFKKKEAPEAESPLVES